MHTDSSLRRQNEINSYPLYNGHLVWLDLAFSCTWTCRRFSDAAVTVQLDGLLWNGAGQTKYQNKRGLWPLENKEKVFWWCFGGTVEYKMWCRWAVENTAMNDNVFQSYLKSHESKEGWVFFHMMRTCWFNLCFTTVVIQSPVRR